MASKAALLSFVLASGVVTTSAHADAKWEDAVSALQCSTQDYQAMEARLEDSEYESTPAFRLEILEEFLSDCPGRIEGPSLAKRAARAALDSGDAVRALTHFQTAIYQGAPFDRESRLDYMTTLVETGQFDRAWTLRDQEVDRWLREIDRRGVASIETERLRDGFLHHINFNAVDPDFQQSDVWLAVPFYDGWPVAIVLGADQKRVALRRLISGEDALTYQHLDLVRCRGRTTLLQKDKGLARVDVSEIALEAANSYLRNPDVYYEHKEGAPIGTCYDTHRMFVLPDPQTALTLSGLKTY
ncbi:MAG: hypothetical protein AAF950_08295 [Pseudomonadota bacterium]